MSKPNLYVIPKEDINNFLDYDDNISVFPSIKAKARTELNSPRLKSIKLIEALKEQKSIINKLVKSKEVLSEKCLQLSSYSNSLEQKISTLEKENTEISMEILATLQNNNDFIDDLIKSIIPKHNIIP